MVYGNFKYLTKRTVSDKILRDKAFNIAINPKSGGYQRIFASMIYNFFDKKASGGAVKNENMLNQKLADELDKPIVRNIEKRKV